MILIECIDFTVNSAVNQKILYYISLALHSLSPVRYLMYFSLHSFVLNYCKSSLSFWLHFHLPHAITLL